MLHVIQQLKALLANNADGHLSIHECIVIGDAVRKLESADRNARDLTAKLEARTIEYGKALDPRIEVEVRESITYFTAVASSPLGAKRFTGLSADLVAAQLKEYDARV